MTNPIKPAVLIPWEHGRIGVEIELEDGHSHAREVDASGLVKLLVPALTDALINDANRRLERQPGVDATWLWQPDSNWLINVNDLAAEICARLAPQKQEGR